MHKRARTTPWSREDIVRMVLQEGQTLKAAAAAFSVCPKTVRKWVARYRQEGPAGLQDRSSRPHRSPNRPAQKRSRLPSPKWWPWARRTSPSWPRPLP